MLQSVSAGRAVARQSPAATMPVSLNTRMAAVATHKTATTLEPVGAFDVRRISSPQSRPARTVTVHVLWENRAHV